MPNDLATAIVKGVIPVVNSWALFLGNEEKTFVIYIDAFVAKAIQMSLSGEKNDRPLTHDLIGSMLLGLGARLDHVLINDVRGQPEIYYARIFLHMENELGKKIVEIDARPSDSIVLALQQKRPIYVVRAVFDAVEDCTDVLERELKRQTEEGDEDETEGDETE
jgi:bifunctional DNase/RNase